MKYRYLRRNSPRHCVHSTQQKPFCIFAQLFFPLKTWKSYDEGPWIVALARSQHVLSHKKPKA